MSCLHYHCNMFIQCPNSQDHLHCIKCGAIITNDILLTYLTQEELDNAVIKYKSKQSCNHIVSHL